jgi:DNA-binding transcriptional LysR family regulator
LFERTTRRVEITPAGTAFVARAAEIERRMDGLREDMEAHATGLRGRLRIAGWYQLEPRLAAFVGDVVAGTSAVEISIVELSAEEMVSQLRSGDIDLALIALHPGLTLQGIECRTIRTEPFVLVVPVDHPLAGRSEVSAAEATREQLVLWRPWTAMRACVDRALESRLRDVRAVVETGEGAALIAFVAAGLGAALMTPSLAAASPNPRVVAVPITDAAPLELAAAWRSGPHSRIVERAIDLVVRGSTSGTPASPA